MWPSTLIALIVLFVVRLVFDQRIGNKLFAAGFLIILAFPFIAKLLQRATGDWAEPPLLRLVRRTTGGVSGDSELIYDPKMNEWQVPFDLIVENAGRGEARNWRLWFSPQDDSTSVVLGASVARREAYVRDTLTGRSETILDSRSRVHDITIAPNKNIRLGETSKIVLRGDAPRLEIRVSLDADGMSSRTYVWELAPNTERRCVLWKEYVLGDDRDL